MNGFSAYLRTAHEYDAQARYRRVLKDRAKWMAYGSALGFALAVALHRMLWGTIG